MLRIRGFRYNYDFGLKHILVYFVLCIANNHGFEFNVYTNYYCVL